MFIIVYYRKCLCQGMLILGAILNVNMFLGAMLNVNMVDLNNSRCNVKCK